MRTFNQPLEELEEWNKAKEALRKDNTPVEIVGCIDSQKCHVMYGLSQEATFTVIITHNELRAKEIFEDYKLFDRNVYLYPAKDLIFYSADIHGKVTTTSRLTVLKKILEKEACTIITTLDAGMDCQLPFDMYKKNCFSVKAGDTLSLEETAKQLVFLGYEKVNEVNGPGEFAIRGGILDVYVLTEELPYRVELWGDEVDNIRQFEVATQRSSLNVKQFVIYPATEVFMDDNQAARGIKKIREDAKLQAKSFDEAHKFEQSSRIKQITEEFIDNFQIYQGLVNVDSYLHYFTSETQTFFDYLDGENAIFFLDDPMRGIERCEAVELEFHESMTNRLEKGYLLPKQLEVLRPLPVLLAKLQQKKLVLLSTLDVRLKDIQVESKFTVNVQSSPSYNNNFSLLAKDVLSLKKRGYRTLLLSASETRGKRLCADLEDYGITAFFHKEKDREIQPGEVMVSTGNLHQGFEYPMLKFVVVTESDMFGVRKKKKRKKQHNYEGVKINSFNDLKVGDYVVHENHGLGIYQGIEKIEVNKVTKDYIKIQYAGGGNLYILATQLDVIQKYAGQDAAKAPKLNKLNSPEWGRTKTRVKGAVKEIAKELVDLYAKRQARQGHSYSKDTVWQKEFEEMFPFEETDDQLIAIDKTKHDMESRKIMDRLICGDVGYGKTEIAIRAAFKAVMDGKQVAFLVPTTILAQQHYNTFVERMKDFPVSVDMMSRFRTTAQQNKTKDRLRKGSLDIVIGTHRLLSKDIEYKDLGLLIVDEEQRFGVTHKEKLKQLKNNIDVLTLSATPIPRTLHMSLVGIRDMSVLEEAPVDRVPIQTFVMEKNDEIIREAVIRELTRGGQVYYVYNRVNNMDVITNDIAKLVPEANVAFAHGQMSERELERIMAAFINGEIDVLVSTTIVETGLDIPNVNTMIIDDADRFGLSQLYQLRGRVGRSNRTAYAFLMYKRDKMIKEVAEKRLQAIKEFTDLGSGFKISMRDLEIRGAGNLLGARQHGHMEAVGYDLYCKMLNDAVRHLKGEKTEEEEYDTSVEIDLDAFIPPEYIKSEAQKLEMYKKVADIENEEELSDCLDELMDRFGEPPKSVQNLLQVALIKAMAHEAYIVKVQQRQDGIHLYMYERAKLKVEEIPDLISRFKAKLKFVPGETVEFIYYPDQKKVVEQVKNVIEKLIALKINEET